jgi:hypothetical protein
MTLAVFKATKPETLSNLLKWSGPREYAFESFTLLAGDGEARSIELGTPLGKITAGGTVSAAQAANAGNTGGGTLTLANPAFTATAKLGVYQITCTTGGADGTSKFRVEDPDGVVVGTATGGAAFNKAIKFTIAHATANFVEGDGFTVTLTQAAGADDGKIIAWDPAATDGSEVIWGFAANAVTAADGIDNEVGGIAIRRQAILREGAIKWPDGLTSSQKAAAIAYCDENRGIVIRA